jgi:hypothetical protein
VKEYVLAGVTYKARHIGGWRQEEINSLPYFPSLPIEIVPLYFDYKTTCIFTMERFPFAKWPAVRRLAMTLVSEIGSTPRFHSLTHMLLVSPRMHTKEIYWQEAMNLSDNV